MSTANRSPPIPSQELGYPPCSPCKRSAPVGYCRRSHARNPLRTALKCLRTGACTAHGRAIQGGAAWRSSQPAILWHSPLRVTEPHESLSPQEPLAGLSPQGGCSR